jgi:hypothetical protein
MNVTLHLTERTFPLHLLFERLQGLVDIVVAHENLDQGSISFGSPACASPAVRGRGGRTKIVSKAAGRRREAGEITEAIPVVHAQMRGIGWRNEQ